MKTQIEQYIEMRNQRRYNINWFYNHYIENSKHKISIQDFERIFKMSNLDSILSHLDNKFRLDVLSDKNGVVVKVFENSNP
jgi:hypothetical protein